MDSMQGAHPLFEDQHKLMKGAHSLKGCHCLCGSSNWIRPCCEFRECTVGSYLRLPPPLPLPLPVPVEMLPLELFVSPLPALPPQLPLVQAYVLMSAQESAESANLPLFSRTLPVVSSDRVAAPASNQGEQAHTGLEAGREW